MENSAEVRWRPRAGQGLTFSQSPAWGKERLFSLAMSLFTSVLEISSVSSCSYILVAMTRHFKLNNCCTVYDDLVGYHLDTNDSFVQE